VAADTADDTDEGGDVIESDDAQPAPPANPATLKQMVWLCVYLFAWVVLLLWQTRASIIKYNQEANAEVRVAWALPANVALKPGPAAFWYEKGDLVHHGAISPERKLELRALLIAQPQVDAPVVAAPPSAAGQPSVPTNATPAANATSARPDAVAVARPGYEGTIDHLAFLSSARQQELVGLLLLLGMLGGALGAILRSLVDFVGHACYTRQLDLMRWWPLYATRPVVGGVLGFVLVAMFKARLLTSGDLLPTDDSLFWLGLTVLGGFSTVDVTMRLRLAAKALFGVESTGKSGGKKG
jgi:hypothetical protein